VLDVPTLLIGRTDALAATLLTSDIDPRDQEFLTGERTVEGFHVVRPGLDQAIARGLAYALTSTWSGARRRPGPRRSPAVCRRDSCSLSAQAAGVQLLPFVQLAEGLNSEQIAAFQRNLAAMGYSSSSSRWPDFTL